jgi:anti-sigma regulatory factor (Ser/Thr protein kinase)/anti-anti-sigma regulatory factor
VSLTATVTADPANGIILITLSGTLTLETAPLVRRTLTKCLVDAPGAVIVEVGALRVDNRSRMTVFPAAARAHAPPGTTLMLCGASAELSTHTGGRILGGVPSFPTYAQARAAVDDVNLRSPRSMSVRLAANPGAPRRARAMVSHACRSWNLDHLHGPAAVVVSELVSNAVEHAGTDVHVTARLLSDHLLLSVRDHSPHLRVLPRPETVDGPRLAQRGRGLQLVEVYTTAWGSHSATDSKTVWATLRATSRTSAARP